MLAVCCATTTVVSATVTCHCAVATYLALLFCAVAQQALFDVDPDATWLGDDHDHDDPQATWLGDDDVEAERPATPLGAVDPDATSLADDDYDPDMTWLADDDEAERPATGLGAVDHDEPDVTWLSLGDHDGDDDSDLFDSDDGGEDGDEVQRPRPALGDHDGDGDDESDLFDSDDDGEDDDDDQLPQPATRVGPPDTSRIGSRAAAEQLPPEQPPTCRCFAEQPDPRRPQHTRIESPYCPLLPFPEYREEPCVCFATHPEPWTLQPHSDVTSRDCPFYTVGCRRTNARSASAASRRGTARCSSCGELGHRNNRSASCLHAVSGRVFQPFVEGSPGRKYHDEEAPTLSDRCFYCKLMQSVTKWICMRCMPLCFVTRLCPHDAF